MKLGCRSVFVSKVALVLSLLTPALWSRAQDLSLDTTAVTDFSTSTESGLKGVPRPLDEGELVVQPQLYMPDRKHTYDRKIFNPDVIVED